jgi:hypothetical protein
MIGMMVEHISEPTMVAYLKEVYWREKIHTVLIFIMKEVDLLFERTLLRNEGFHRKRKIE